MLKVAQIYKFHFGLDRNISNFLGWSTTNIVKDNTVNTKEVIKYREKKHIESIQMFVEKQAKVNSTN